MDLVNDKYTIYLPQNIRCLRKKQNLSQEELAGRIGLNRGNIASYENGTAEPKICNLLKLSTLFGVSITDLTQKDLSDEETLAFANDSYQQIDESEDTLAEKFVAKAGEIEEVFRSLHTCNRFKTSMIGEMPKDMQILLFNFEQLYEAAQSLLCNHKAMLEYIQRRKK